MGLHPSRCCWGKSSVLRPGWAPHRGCRGGRYHLYIKPCLRAAAAAAAAAGGLGFQIKQRTLAILDSLLYPSLFSLRLKITNNVPANYPLPFEGEGNKITPVRTLMHHLVLMMHDRISPRCKQTHLETNGLHSRTNPFTRCTSMDGSSSLFIIGCHDTPDKQQAGSKPVWH